MVKIGGELSSNKAQDNTVTNINSTRTCTERSSDEVIVMTVSSKTVLTLEDAPQGFTESPSFRESFIL